MQTELLGVYLSLIGSATLDLVMTVGVDRIDGTAFLVTGSVTVPFVVGVWPLTSCAIALMAGSASADDGL